METRRPTLFIIMLAVLFLSPFGIASPTLNGQSLLQERCTKCHGPGRITQAKNTEKGWKATVRRMVGKGAKLSASEQEKVVQYLAETYPK